MNIVGSYITLVISSIMSFLTSTLTPISILCDRYGILCLSAKSCIHFAPVRPGAMTTFLDIMDFSFFDGSK